MGQRIDYTEPLKVETEARKYLDNIYKKYGFIINRIEGINNKSQDLILSLKEMSWKIEEKAASYYVPYMPFEEHQDYPYWDGWIFYTKAEAIIYFYFKEKGKWEPYICYFIDWKKAKKLYEKTHDDYRRSYQNTKYKGDTRGILISWNELIDYKIASIIFKSQACYLHIHKTAIML